MSDNAVRHVSELVQGNQISLIHIICRPDKEILEMLGLENGSIAIVSLTPSEASIIAADFITKTVFVRLHFVDRYRGTVLVSGGLAAVETALEQLMCFLVETMNFERTQITKS